MIEISRESANYKSSDKYLVAALKFFSYVILRRLMLNLYYIIVAKNKNIISKLKPQVGRTEQVQYCNAEKKEIEE
jgi:hypothetical protein